MGALFGTETPVSKEPQISDHDRTMLQLKSQRDNLNKYRKKVLYFCINPNNLSLIYR